MKKNKVVALATTIAIASTLGTTAVLGNVHKQELNVLEEDLTKSYKTLREREILVKDLQKTLVSKSESYLSLEEKYGQLTLENDTLKENFDKTKSEYEKNLKALNVAEKKLEEKKTSAISYGKAGEYNGDYTKWKKMTVESTAYTSFENGDELAGRKWGNLTASGEPVRYGVIAVDTRVIPLGTEVYIPALNKVFVALDTGSAIKGNIIDIYFNTYNETVQWGRKHGLEVYVNM